jgi:hypothetical protein
MRVRDPTIYFESEYVVSIAEPSQVYPAERAQSARDSCAAQELPERNSRGQDLSVQYVRSVRFVIFRFCRAGGEAAYLGTFNLTRS